LLQASVLHFATEACLARVEQLMPSTMSLSLWLALMEWKNCKFTQVTNIQFKLSTVTEYFFTALSFFRL
jgi:ABC-type uncharacterized transport system permease subunit